MRPVLRFALAALVLAMAALVVPAAANAAPHRAPPRAWVRVPSPAVPDGSSITAIAAVAVTDAWAVGSTPAGGLVEHWNGVRWTLVHAPAAHLVSVAASSPSDVWVTSETATSWRLFHWNGRTWSGGGAGLPSTAGPGYGDVHPAISDARGVGAWAAVNVTVPGGAGAAVFRWHGTSWHRVGPDITVPGSVKPPWYADGAPAAVATDNVWLGGITQSGDPADGDSAHWDGSAWTVSREVQGATPCCQVTVSRSGGRLWAHGSYPGVRTGQPIIASLAGTTWRPLATQPSGNDIMSADALAADGLGNLWVEGPAPGPVLASPVLRWDGTTWTQQKFPGDQAAVNDISDVPGTAVIWAVGSYTAPDGRTQPLFDVTSFRRRIG